jgi:hypothetical protein
MLFVVLLCGGGASSIRVIFQHYDGTDGVVTWKTTTLLHSVKCFPNNLQMILPPPTPRPR